MIFKSKWMSLLTAIAMSCTVMGIIGTADESAANGEISTADETGKSKILLTTEYMGSETVPSETGQTSVSLKAADKGNRVWIGVGAKSVASGLQMSELDLFTQGVYSLEISFAYDSRYILPYSATAGVIDEDIWAGLVSGGTIGTENNDAWWSGDYSMEAACQSEIAIDEETEPLNIADADAAEWRMCSVNLKFTGADMSVARFSGMTSEPTAKQYLIKLPFKLIDVPAESSAEVIKLIRGPAQFNIGAGEYGAAAESFWEKNSTTVTGYSNLKNVFEYGGDILLFSEGSAVTDIMAQTIVPPETGDGEEETKTPENLDLYHSITLEGEKGFQPTQTDYYISVKNETDKIKLLVAATGQVTINDESVTETESIDGVTYRAKEVALTELDIGTVDSDNGFIDANKFVVKSGSAEYNVHVRRLLKPSITLNYGNSPYGEIMKAFAGETVEIDGVQRNKAEAAKEAFAANNNKYDSALIPPNAVDKTDMYPRYAWVDIQNAQELTEEEKEALANPDINIDVNDYAIFIYNGKPFIDPGFVATDSMGKPVENLARTFKGAQRLSALNAWTAMADANVQAQADIAIAAAPSNAKIEDITKAFVDGQMDSYPIRPNVYDMEYSFEDENDGTVTVTRKVVVLQSEGDTDFSYSINDNDIIPITVRVKAAAQYDIITNPVARRVYEYRCIDLMDFEAINDNDKVPVVAATKTKTQPKTRYVPLEENEPIIEF